MRASRRLTAAPQSSAPPMRASGFVIVILVSLLLALALALGGGGVRYGLANLVIQLAALALLAFHRTQFADFWTTAPISLRLLTGATALVPLLHLVPLPETLWSALPGRELVAQSREAIGINGWTAASVDPARTLVALTGLIVPLTVLTVGWAIPRRHLMTVGWVVVALGLITALIGVPQVLSGGNFAVFYSERGPTGLLYGTFANRNSTGLFLVAALTLAALLPLPLARPHPIALPVRLGIFGFLLLAIVLTQSRTAFVLAVIPIGLGLLRAMSAAKNSKSSNSGRSRSALPVVAALGLGVIVISGVLAVAPGRVGATIERFQGMDDARVYIWEDATYSAGRYWPMGSGMGTFDEVFQVDESLENLTKRRAGRAHNDYIELAIEAGLPGLTVALLWLVLIGWLSWRASRSQFRWAAWGGGAILLAIALQSITDYPLRNQAVLALAAFAMLMLARIASSEEEQGH